MTTAKKLISAAGAAGAGEAATYVDDVFSTYLYEGTNATQNIKNGIKLGNNLAGPSALFNDTSDYLNGTLSGGSDTKTLTFSGWFYKLTDDNSNPFAIHDNSGNIRFYFNLDGGAANTFQLRGYNSSGTQIFRVTSNATALNTNNWYHVLLSIDLTNTSNRYLYLNDVAVSANWMVYTNDNIALSQQDTFVGTYNSSQTGDVQTYISNLYLDYTFRDLSTESNRRLFIASDETPATGQASLNPILYLPFDSASLGSNAGTGGDLSTVGSPYYDADFGPYIGTDGEGGLVWLKNRSLTVSHRLIDTERGVGNRLESDTTSGQYFQSDQFVTGFNSSGFTVDGSETGANDGYTPSDYVSWTFRKAPGFLDIVTYTGDGATSRDISHNLETAPGVIIIKRTDTTSDWTFQHVYNNNYTHYLNLTDYQSDSGATLTFNTSTFKVVGPSSGLATTKCTNVSGASYVAYLFANDAQDFGTDSDESIIKCGSFTTSAGSDNSTDVTASVNLGFEPQWILMKPASATGDWLLVDVMRGITTPYSDFSYTGNDNFLRANTSGPDTEYGFVNATSTGFNVYRLLGSTEYIYMAIRRPHKPASEFAATDLFNVDLGDANDPGFDTGFPVDMGIFRYHESTADFDVMSRLTGARRLDITAGVEASKPNAKFDYMDGWVSSGMGSHTGWAWRRAPGYFDVVAYGGDGVTGREVPHNLGVAPEMMWVKSRTGTQEWVVVDDPASGPLYLHTNASRDSGTLINGWSDEALIFGAGYTQVNNASFDYIAYLFATVAGISKVGSYTGTGNDINVDCGFSAGARFVLVKRTDSTGDWYLWDSVRGIVAGNDPYLLLNSDAAQDSSYDYIDPLSSGFTVTSSAPAALNASGGTYLFYAIA